MGLFESQRSEGIATLTLRRGKVIALDGAVVDQLREQFAAGNLLHTV